VSGFEAEDDESFNPLEQGAAAPPRMIGGGCLARFDPEELNEASGADFASAFLPTRPAEEGSE
tara:strand:- start:12399 stop:12587 length:189 start_codon:yes stop_codon:yes gene_type:complete